MESRWVGRHDISVVLLFTFSTFSITLTPSYAIHNMAYRAAVYEHAVVTAPSRVVSRAEAVAHMMRNVRVYGRQARIAASKGAKILVFPEHGVAGRFLDRFTVNAYLEEVPDPRKVRWNPTEAPNAYNNTEIQQEFSRIAKENKIYIVVNMGTKRPCTAEEMLTCASDGQHQFNSNLVYSDDGTLIAVYHKRNQFFVSSLESAMKPEYVTFDTPFGKFATLTGLDIISNQPAFVLLGEYKIRNIALPSAWMKITPFFRSVAVYAAFARGHSINLLVAGLHSLDYASHGSGLFGPNGAKAFYYETHKQESKLLIADMDAISERLPFSHSTLPPKIDPRIVAKENHLYGSVFGLHILFQPLRKSQGVMGVCSGDFCCSLDYETDKLTEPYALGVGNGFLYAVKSKFYIQLCSLSKCQQEKNCIAKVTGTTTIFKRFTLTGHNFKTEQLSPNILVMNGSSFQFSDYEWTYNYTGRIYVERPMALPLHSAILVGRVYNKDTFDEIVYESNDLSNKALAKTRQTNYSPYIFVVAAMMERLSI